ncbi:sugar ABC transporter permease [Agromyces sp. NBRC 114283]|jgi:sorbitol/mannitol transport system permease protein|uniref:carbohydrate ABC transporter permease n=1 Tax=Agromyces sp. NBRC 114283 TaxID=2994521 RepID=UPI0024A3C86E|nr:sugar ABC transporter permease [Agromyces sp. NBRC 114283]GLU91282.1 sugar ABC transporter permease [Agromyces sp. NBRC 114283]
MIRTPDAPTATSAPEGSRTRGPSGPGRLAAAAAHERRENRRRWLPLWPAFLFLVVLTQLPFVVTLVISVLDWNILRPDAFGFAWVDNFVAVFTDARMLPAVLNTIVLTAGVVIVSLVIGTAVALLLDRPFPGRGVARTLMIAPFMVMPMAAALIWKHAILDPNFGMLQRIADWAASLTGAAPQSIDLLNAAPMTALIASLVWTWAPFMMLIVLAGLQGQPDDVLEAARVDGANEWRIFVHMTLPHLRSYLSLAAVLGTLYVVQTFDAVFAITQGGPGTATTNLPFEIYQTMFRKFDYGQTAAASVVVIAGALVIANLFVRVLTRLGKERGA